MNTTRSPARGARGAGDRILLDNPIASWPRMSPGSRKGRAPRTGAGRTRRYRAVTRMTASVGASITGSGTRSTLTSRLPCQVTAFTSQLCLRQSSLVPADSLRACAALRPSRVSRSNRGWLIAGRTCLPGPSPFRRRARQHRSADRVQQPGGQPGRGGGEPHRERRGRGQRQLRFSGRRSLDDLPGRAAGVHPDERQRRRQAEPGELLALAPGKQGVEVERVRIRPGTTVVTDMGRAPSSARRPSEKPTAANFAVAYGIRCGTLTLPPTEVMATIRPCSWRRMTGRAASDSRTGASAIVCTAVSKSAMVRLSTGPPG